MIEATTSMQNRKRIFWLDNLRTIIILFVVLYHVGGVYEAGNLWGWFWIVDDPNTITWVGIVGIMFDIMVMPIMFFISGYLAPVSIQNRTDWGFIKNKINRLMLPWLVAVLTLIPIYKIIFLYSRNLPQEHWSTYFHITNPNSQNWLWFLPVLFVFNILYLLFIKAKIKIPKISLKSAIGTIFIIGFISSYILGGILGFRNWTLTPLIDFENERLLLYFMMFLLGAYCYRQNALTEIPKSKMLYNIVNAIAWIPITLHIFVRIYPFIYPDGFLVTPLYRLIWWGSFYLSLLCLAYAMVITFQIYFDKTSKVWKTLNQNSYGVYIIHVIMIGILGTFLLNMKISSLIKYPILIISTYLGSNVIVSIYRSLAKIIKSSVSKHTD